MTRIRRGAAHCRNADCFSRHQIVPLVPFALEHACASCGQPCAIDAEFGTGLGSSRIYNEVRVYFAFDASTRTYADVALTSDDTIVGQHSAYAFFSPLVRDRAEAERVAASLLARLNGPRGDARPLRTRATRSELLDEGWRVAS
jgi:hypothetical protein